MCLRFFRKQNLDMGHFRNFEIRTEWVWTVLNGALLTTTNMFRPQVYVLKRPHVDEFLKRMGELFECVLFTASLSKVRMADLNGAKQCRSQTDRL